MLAVKALNVQKVRLGLSRLTRLAYGAFYEPVGSVLSWVVTWPLCKNDKKFDFYECIKIQIQN